jgi:hypothetical protein
VQRTYPGLPLGANRSGSMQQCRTDGATLSRPWCNVTGLHTADTGAGVPLNLVAATVGPRYTWTNYFASQRTVSIFGEDLIGEAHGLDSLFPRLFVGPKTGDQKGPKEVQ